MSQPSEVNQLKSLVPVAEMTFEQALTELENIVKKLESGQESLEAAIFAYEYGNSLRDHCEKKLNEAQLRVDKIVQKQGQLTLEPTSIT
jgi:exodeoxyribonuclease VII small subunit